MFKYVLLLALLTPVISHAEIFRCTFTEPYKQINYNTATQTAIVTDNAGGDSRVKYINVHFSVVAAGEFMLSRNGLEVARLKLTGGASDGQSPTVYPFEITTSLIGGANSGIGGCSSSLLKAKKG